MGLVDFVTLKLSIACFNADVHSVESMARVFNIWYSVNIPLAQSHSPHYTRFGMWKAIYCEPSIWKRVIAVTLSFAIHSKCSSHQSIRVFNVPFTIRCKAFNHDDKSIMQKSYWILPYGLNHFSTMAYIEVRVDNKRLCCCGSIYIFNTSYEVYSAIRKLLSIALILYWFTEYVLYISISVMIVQVQLSFPKVVQGVLSFVAIPLLDWIGGVGV